LYVEPAADAGWRTGGWNSRRSVTSADCMLVSYFEYL